MTHRGGDAPLLALLEAFDAALHAHRAADYDAIAARWRDVATESPPVLALRERDFALVMRFWDDWADAAADWTPDEPSEDRDAWLSLAMALADTLREGNPVTDPRFAAFRPEPETVMAERLRRTLWQLGSTGET